MVTDFVIIDEQLDMPDNPMFNDYMQRMRTFDQHPALVGWRPRPPNTPLKPEVQPRLPHAHQVDDPNTFRSRVRRANMSARSNRWAPGTYRIGRHGKLRMY